jgi:lysophospholipase-3
MFVALVVSGANPTFADTRSGDTLTPVVFFPGLFANKLLVEVKNQTAFPECPRSGTFTVQFVNDTPSTEFSQICQDKLFTLDYNPNRGEPMPSRFSNPRC